MHSPSTVLRSTNFVNMGNCKTPLTVRNKLSGQSAAVPCGKCPDCLSRLVSAWSFRLMQEDRFAESAYFLTLTYSTTHVPYSKNRYKTLDKKDVINFIKRLRKATDAYYNKRYVRRSVRPTIKYFACGEYGSTKGRPHYHLIIFNARLELIESAWQKGAVHYGTVSQLSVGYTLKYMMKPPRKPQHQRDDRKPEFRLMSKGLGECYLNKDTILYHTADIFNRYCVNTVGGGKAPMARYYKNRIYNEYQIKAIAAHFAIEAEKKYLEEANNSSTLSTHNKIQSDLAAIRRMYFNSQSRNSIF